MPTLLVSEGFAGRHNRILESLGEQSPNGLQLHVLSADPQPGELEGVDAAFVSMDLVASGINIRGVMEALRDAAGVQWVHLGWVGSDSPMVRALMARGVKITNSAGATAEPIALSLIGAMLVLYRGFHRWFDAQRRQSWEPLPRDQAPPDLRGQTMVILGLGGIGTHTAHFARALGLHVIGIRRRPATAADGVDEWVHPDRLASVLPRANWLAITVPLTAATRQLIDRDAIRLLPKGAYLLNVSRGAIVDQLALTEALMDNHLAGAYLDVFDAEPLVADSPLWSMPNVVVSPHDSWKSQGNDARTDAMFLDELRRWLRDEPLAHLVTED